MIPKTLPPKARPPAKAAAAALPPAKAALPPAKSAAALPVPTGSGYFGYGYFGSGYSGSKSGSFGSVPSASIVPVSTGTGDLFERLQPPQKPLHNLLSTIEELEQMDDELLNFEMTFRSIPFTAETTQEEKIRLILQHHNPSKG